MGGSRQHRISPAFIHQQGPLAAAWIQYHLQPHPWSDLLLLMVFVKSWSTKYLLLDIFIL